MSRLKFLINEVKKNKELLMLFSCFAWVFSTVRYHFDYSITYLVLLHVSTPLLLLSSFYWITSYFKKLRKKQNSSNQGLGLGESTLLNYFNAGLALNIIVFAPVVLFTNWLPYSSINPPHKWDSILRTSFEMIDAKNSIGENIESDLIKGTVDDSIAMRKYHLRGISGSGTLSVSVNKFDSILSLEFEKHSSQ